MDELTQRFPNRDKSKSPSPLIITPIDFDTTNESALSPFLPTDLVHSLHTHHLFSSATDSQIEDIASRMHVRSYKSGDIIIREGDIGRTMYFLLRGTVQVLHLDNEQVLAEMNQGVFFGELSMLFNIPRTATVMAKCKCIVSALSRLELESLLKQNTDLSQKIYSVANERLSMVQSRENIEVRRFSIAAIRERLTRIEALKKCDEKMLESLVKRIEVRNYRPNNIIIDEEDSGYVIFVMEGFLEVNDYEISGSEMSSNTRKIGPGESVMGFLGKTKKSSIGRVIKSISDSEVYLLSLNDLQDNDQFDTSLLSNIRTLEAQTPLKSVRNSNNNHIQVSSTIITPEEPKAVEDLLKTSSFVPRTQEIKAFIPARRRASLAVWADSRLTAIANSKHATLQPQTTPISKKHSLMKILSCELDNAELMQTQIMEVVLVNAFRKLSLVDLLRVRGVCKRWFKISKDTSLWNYVDLSEYHKSINDGIVEVLLLHCGSRIQNLVLKLCFQITNSCLAKIGEHAPNLVSIDLHSCWDITETGLTVLVKGCKMLKSIDLSNCRKIDDNCVFSLFTHLPQLESVAFSYCKLLTNNAMLFIVQLSQSLQGINLQRCTGISDSGFQHLPPNHFVNLLNLNLSDCSFLTDTALCAAVKSCPNLNSLNLSFCCGLSESSLEQVATLLYLQALDVSFCGAAVSDAILTLLVEKLEYLEKLSVRGCLRVTDEGISSLLKNGHLMKILNISSCKFVSNATIAACKSRWTLLDNVPLESMDGMRHLRRSTY